MGTVRCSGRLLAGGGCTQGRYLLGGGGWGVYSGVSIQGMSGRPPCEQNYWQTGVNTLPCHNYFVDSKYVDLIQI